MRTNFSVWFIAGSFKTLFKSQTIQQNKTRLHQCYFDFKRNLKLSLSSFKTEKRQGQREF